MKKSIYYVSIVLVCLMIWCILCESISLYTIIFGLLSGGITVLFMLFYYNNVNEKDFVNPFRVAVFYLILCVNIYKSAIEVIKILLFKMDGVEIVEAELNTKSAIKSMIIASSITLTPGTVTIEKSEGKLTVLQFCALNKNNVLSNTLMKLIGGN